VTALAAAVWAGLFALASLYWALGGQAGGETLGVEIERLARERDPALVAQLWAAFVLKALAAVLALALWQGRGGRPVRMLSWVVGSGLTLYGAANLVQHALMAAGAIATPDGLGEDAVPWHLALWDPVWLIGGLLFLAAAHAAPASSSGR
jgi:hypothetical protein